MTNYWTVIPSCCRPAELAELTAQLTYDGVQVVVIDTGYAPEQLPVHPMIHIIVDRDEPKNISRWWNLGLRYVAAQEPIQDFVVAVLNDDVRVPASFVQIIGAAMEGTGVAIACPDVYGIDYRRVTALTDGPRMPGYAFAMRGDNMIYADERFQWWYGDNDIDWQARGRGGVAYVPGLHVQHLYPNSTTVGELAEQAGRDRETFIAKWGRAPW